MPKNGYVIGISTDSNTNPDQYWGGAVPVADIEEAVFIGDLGTARVEAGKVQSITPDKHVEPYPAVKTTAHNPPLPTTGAGGL